MRIPSKFTQVIADTFFDKTIDLYSVGEITDKEGFTRRDVLLKTGDFTGNVYFTNLEEVRQDYGIEEQIDVVISTHEEIEAGVIVGYGGKDYRVVKAIPRDSHNLLIGRSWSSMSSGSISA